MNVGSALCLKKESQTHSKTHGGHDFIRKTPVEFSSHFVIAVTTFQHEDMFKTMRNMVKNMVGVYVR